MNLFESIIRTAPIDKGWSGDRKYCAVTKDGQKYLLRVSPAAQTERKRREYESARRAEALGIPICQSLAFGTCPEGVYILQSWIDGADAEELLPTLDLDTQYRYGLDAGRILAKMHTISASADAPDWENRFNAKIDRKLAAYHACPLKYENGDAFENYLAGNRHLLKDRPQCWQHGDYHIGNMIIGTDGMLCVIDFEKQDVGDPWEEFNRIVWSAQAAPAFAAGMVDGYFDGRIPQKFWNLLALYISSNTLGSLPWAIPFGEEEIRVMQNQAEQVLQWYDGMTNTVPAWYRKYGRM